MYSMRGNVFTTDTVSRSTSPRVGDEQRVFQPYAHTGLPNQRMRLSELMFNVSVIFGVNGCDFCYKRYMRTAKKGFVLPCMVHRTVLTSSGLNRVHCLPNSNPILSWRCKLKQACPVKMLVATLNLTSQALALLDQGLQVVLTLPRDSGCTRPCSQLWPWIVISRALQPSSCFSESNGLIRHETRLSQPLILTTDVKSWRYAQDMSHIRICLLSIVNHISQSYRW